MVGTVVERGQKVFELKLSVGGRFSRAGYVAALNTPPQRLGRTAVPLVNRIPISERSEMMSFVITTPHSIGCPPGKINGVVDDQERYCHWNDFIRTARESGFDWCPPEAALSFALDYSSVQVNVGVIGNSPVYVAVDPLPNSIEFGTHDIFRVQRSYGGHTWLSTMPCSGSGVDGKPSDHLFDLDRFFLLKDIRIIV